MRKMMLEDEFGDVIKKARQGRELSFADIAEQIALTTSQLAEIESYRLIPDEEVIHALASVLELRSGPLLDLAHGEWQPAPHPPATGNWRVCSMALRDTAGFISNTHLLWHSEQREAVVIDPGFQPAEILHAIAANDLIVRYVVITHGHRDHVAAAPVIARTYQVPVLLGAEDLVLLPAGIPQEPFHSAPGGLQLAIADSALQVIATPGHTVGGRCYLFPGGCFVGDTLFAGSIGRSGAGSANYLCQLVTVREKILRLPPETLLFPGHGPNTTVVEECAHNPFA
ncbi:MAG: MBL fold metallo-hydrolase [Cyanobacteria bacterium NC_groundwater_1444_Ag_S-0.65um_54_12]|nr:MBL fold metallo-hydrolase [Cyanobacteria bacterium NC_groundwater_1444_Ag_S-0.65um_54_12]